MCTYTRATSRRTHPPPLPLDDDVCKCVFIVIYPAVDDENFGVKFRLNYFGGGRGGERTQFRLISQARNMKKTRA